MAALVTACARGDARTAGKTLADELTRGLGAHTPALIFVFASTSQPLDELLPELRGPFGDVTILSATTAGEFTEKEVAKGAVVAAAVVGDFEVYAGMGTGLAKDPEAAVSQAIAELPTTREGFPHRTGVMLLDPLSGNAEEATLMCAGLMDGAVRLAGGAAGDDLAMKATQVALGSRVASDAIVVASIFSKKPLGIGVSHGHTPLSEPLEVTRAEGAVVHEIEGRPAWDVWKERTAEAAQAAGIDPDALSGDDVGGFLLRFEAGLANGREYKIRAPLARGDDGSLSFACGVPQGAVVRITESTADRQVDSAIEAANRARAQLDGEPAGAIVFDCICRNLILGERFDDAVDGVSKALGGAPVAGFETYGEIALDVGDMSGFHNTTTVVLAFPA